MLGVFFVSIQSFPNPLINEIKNETFISMLVIDKFVMFVLICTLWSFLTLSTLINSHIFIPINIVNLFLDIVL